MRFEPTAISGVTVVRSDAHEDGRGSFRRTYCAQDFRDAGLEPVEAQAAISRNARAGTLRGLHVIPEAEGEAKLVRCIAGRVFDVAVDLRPASPTYGKWTALELSADNGLALHLARGIGHGFVTLERGCDVAYQFSRPHRAGIERGVRWDDPDLAIDWPRAPEILSERDGALPSFARWRED